jgi:sulfite reductase beta subunit-like hemoprotein
VSDVLTLGNLLVGGGMSAVLVALIGAVFGRRMKQADYARALVETANDLTDRVDERNQRLEEKVEKLELRVGELADLLRAAIPLLLAAGHEAAAAEMRAALSRRTA